MRRHTITFAFAMAAACSSDSEKGNVSFTTWGEEYIEDEIPAADVADGWVIRYNKFLVNIGPVKVADTSGAIGGQMATSKLFDQTKKGVKAVVTLKDLEAKNWTRVSYEIAPVAADTDATNASDADKTLMIAGGYSVYVDGTATKGAVTKNYKWGFNHTTVYDRCEGEVSGKSTEGVVVTNGGTDEPQLTIHGDHLYYDDLQSKDAVVRFDNIADADANMDGNVTLEELAAVKLASLPAANGPYGVGNQQINDLGTYVAALSRTVGHYRGEGECFASAK